MKNKTDAIYTHDEAALIVEKFEDLLEKYSILLPSPEDDDRDVKHSAALYGTTYGNLLDDVENSLINILEKHQKDTQVVMGIFSGTV